MKSCNRAINFLKIQKLYIAMPKKKRKFLELHKACRNSEGRKKEEPDSFRYLGRLIQNNPLISV